MTRSSFLSHPLVAYLRDPQVGLAFVPRDWERLFRAARHGQLSSRVACIAEANGLLERLPEKVQFHMRSARRVSDSQATSVRWEIVKVREALAVSQTPFVVLKGAAYIQSGLKAGAGRVMSDIDIMVPQAQLAIVETELCANGWFPTKLDKYDQRYYREWMHELPPMQHLDRGTHIDVHHTILPPTALLKPDVAKLWASSVSLGGDKLVHILSPVDLVLHSATHLFHDSEFEHALRDLVDMDGLIREFSVEPDFLTTLVKRAHLLDLGRPLHYALKYCKIFLHTPIDEGTLERAEEMGSQSSVVRAIMDAVVMQSVGSVLQERPNWRSHAAQFLMYVRAHFLRMPLHLLIPHLIRKQFAPAETR